MRLEPFSKSLNLALRCILVCIPPEDILFEKRASSEFDLTPSESWVSPSASPVAASMDSTSPSSLSISELLRSLYTISLVPFTLLLQAAFCRGDLRTLAEGIATGSLNSSSSSSLSLLEGEMICRCFLSLSLYGLYFTDTGSEDS